MFTRIYRRRPPSPACSEAYVVEKIFYPRPIGAFTYLYLFLGVAGSFDIKFEFTHSHPWATAILVLGILYLLFVLFRAFWPRIVKWWNEAKEGGAILGEPRKYLLRVFTPSLLAWCASLGVMSVFLAAYDIPVSFNTLMRICGGNSIANVTSVTPGGAGVNQAFNVASLNGVTDATTATAYSVAQQLGDDSLEHPLRDPHARLGLRLDRRQGARRAPTSTRRRRRPSRRPRAPSERGKRAAEAA
jgi:hypothetical protein